MWVYVFVRITLILISTHYICFKGEKRKTIICAVAPFYQGLSNLLPIISTKQLTSSAVTFSGTVLLLFVLRREMGPNFEMMGGSKGITSSCWSWSSCVKNWAILGWTSSWLCDEPSIPGRFCDIGTDIGVGDGESTVLEISFQYGKSSSIRLQLDSIEWSFLCLKYQNWRWTNKSNIIRHFVS